MSPLLFESCPETVVLILDPAGTLGYKANTEEGSPSPAQCFQDNHALHFNQHTGRLSLPSLPIAVQEQTGHISLKRATGIFPQAHKATVSERTAAPAPFLQAAEMEMCQLAGRPSAAWQRHRARWRDAEGFGTGVRGQEWCCRPRRQWSLSGL